MSDPTLDDVVREAYASSLPAAPDIETLAIYYDGLVDSEGQPTEIRIFNGENATSVSSSGVPTLLATLEDDASLNAGETVSFTGIPFYFTFPDMTTDPVGRAQLDLDNVGREMSELLEAASYGGKSIRVTFRRYLKGSELDGPAALPPHQFNLTNVVSSNESISGKLEFLSFGNKRFPKDIYQPETFRTLKYA